MATQTNPSQPQPKTPVQPGTGEDQNLGGGNNGNNTEVNPGNVGDNTEVDLDTQKVKTYEGDNGSNSPNKH